jgi:gliding motility-associated-like protein
LASDGTPPYSFAWADGMGNPIGSNSNNIANIAAGNYSLTVTDSYGCTQTTSIIVNEPPPLNATYLTTDETCPGSADGVVTIIASGGIAPYQYALPSRSSNDPTFNGLAPGNYTAVVTDSNNCETTTSFTIHQADDFTLTFNPDRIKITIGNEVTLQPIVISSDTSGWTFQWEPQNGLSCTTCANPVAAPFITTTYQLTVTNPEGCSTTSQITIEVENNQIIYVPNAFSPNGDGLNDVLRVFGVSIKSINFSIFDRWGEKIFSVETSDLNNGWDGTYRGKLLPPNVFVYYLDAEFEDGQRKQMKGSVTILR